MANCVLHIEGENGDEYVVRDRVKSNQNLIHFKCRLHHRFKHLQMHSSHTQARFCFYSFLPFYDLLGRKCLSTVLHTGSATSKLVLVTYKATYDTGGKEPHRILTIIMVSPISSK